MRTSVLFLLLLLLSLAAATIPVRPEAARAPRAPSPLPTHSPWASARDPEPCQPGGPRLHGRGSALGDVRLIHTADRSAHDTRRSHGRLRQPDPHGPDLPLFVLELRPGGFLGAERVQLARAISESEHDLLRGHAGRPRSCEPHQLRAVRKRPTPDELRRPRDHTVRHTGLRRRERTSGERLHPHTRERGHGRPPPRGRTGASWTCTPRAAYSPLRLLGGAPPELLVLDGRPVHGRLPGPQGRRHRDDTDCIGRDLGQRRRSSIMPRRATGASPCEPSSTPLRGSRSHRRRSWRTTTARGYPWRAAARRRMSGRPPSPSRPRSPRQAPDGPSKSIPCTCPRG